MEQLQYNLVRWFLGLEMDEELWVAGLQQEPRPLLEGDVAQALFQEVLCQARAADLLSTNTSAWMER